VFLLAILANRCGEAIRINFDVVSALIGLNENNLCIHEDARLYIKEVVADWEYFSIFAHPVFAENFFRQTFVEVTYSAIRINRRSDPDILYVSSLWKADRVEADCWTTKVLIRRPFEIFLIPIIVVKTWIAVV